MTALLTTQFANQREQHLAANSVLVDDSGSYAAVNGAGQLLSNVTHTPTPGNLGIVANTHCFTLQRSHPLLPYICYFDVNPDNLGIATHRISFRKGFAAGWKKGFYLPFKANLIVSLELSDDASYFFTANLSGCSIYIERDTVTNAIRVYHANAMSLTQGGGDQGAQHYMDKLYLAARPMNSRLIGRCDAALYNRQPNVYLTRKRGNQRQNVQTLGFTTVHGFRVGNSQWDFYFQTCANYSYTVPGTTPGVFSSFLGSPGSSLGSLLTWSDWPGTVAPINKQKALAIREVSKVPVSLQLDL